MPLTKSGKLNLSETDKAYIAGIIDGEGCITAATDVRSDGRMKLRECVIVCMTDIHFMENLHNLLGNRGTLKIIKYPKGNRKNVGRLDIRCNQAREILTLIRPYLKIKGQQADLVMSIPHSIGRGYWLTPAQINIHQTIKSKLSCLNTRGRQSIYAFN